jgi:hypothetical protein
MLYASVNAKYENLNAHQLWGGNHRRCPVFQQRKLTTVQAETERLTGGDRAFTLGEQDLTGLL